MLVGAQIRSKLHRPRALEATKSMARSKQVALHARICYGKRVDAQRLRKEHTFLMDNNQLAFRYQRDVHQHRIADLRKGHSRDPNKGKDILDHFAAIEAKKQIMKQRNRSLYSGIYPR